MAVGRDIDATSSRDGEATSESVPDRSEDAALVASIGLQRHSALERAYQRHSDAVSRLARRVVLDRALAEEVTQEVFLRLWSKPQRFDPCRGSLRSFLLADCHGRALDVVRNEESRRRREAHDVVIDLRDAQESHDVAESVCAAAAASEVTTALRCLPPDERVPIALAYYGGNTYREVASLLHTPEGTVKSRIRRGLDRLGHLQAAVAMDSQSD